MEPEYEDDEGSFSLEEANNNQNDSDVATSVQSLRLRRSLDWKKKLKKLLKKGKKGGKKEDDFEEEEECPSAASDLVIPLAILT